MPYAPYIYGATIIILLLEIISGRHRGIYDRPTWFVTLGCILGNVLTRPISTLLIATIFGLLLPGHRNALAGSNPVWAYIAVFCLTEFAFYWGHRWAHESKGKRHDWLWKLHRTHHSGKFMNVAVTIRIHPLWSFVVPTSWVLGLATYLGLQQAAGLSLLTVYGWNLITHANFRWDDPIRANRHVGWLFRALEHVLVSPGMHHTHHGYGKDGGNFRNYAVTLAVFDWMFGTLYIPSGRPWRYGVPGPNAHWSEEVLFPLVRHDRAARDPMARKASSEFVS